MNQINARKLIESFNFGTLFAEELFWNRLPSSITLEANGQTFLLAGIAEKSGVQVYACPAQEDGSLPPYALRQKIERALTRQAREHLIIYADAARTIQIWQWVAREPGKPAAMREIQWQRSSAADLLLEKLHLIAFRLEDDDTLLTVLDVAGKLRDAFDREKLTKRFYDSFKLERDAFAAFIDGIPDAANQSWYTSVMINRLMFVYFLQRKPLPNGQFFLDNDHDYLRHHLTKSQANGENLFYSGFLCPLFFQGFAQGDKRDEVTARFGDIPYLNGGLFARHPLEEKFGAALAIPDSAFNHLFDFFDKWDWHLDDKPITDSKGKEINPDVLGYIFEKYVNQKQMGAYYTKEDITGYICRNTIVPFLLERMRERCGKAFADAAWPLLQADPDRYIWPAMQKGADQPLPPEIEIGIDTAQPDLIVRRKGWHRSAPDSHALPTEIWRETIARRERYQDVRNKLLQGAVHDVNDLITYNLDICQFAQDVIERSDDPAIVRALWRALVGVIPGANESHRHFEHGISVLDPTCGSGAFLFAALNILEPLYHACLQRMRAWVLQADLDGDSKKYLDFRTTLADVDARPNEKYFVYKSIIVGNLYGVDIMDEAVEIAKLRLFLKLVSQLSDKRDIEPLPDIDFNIRAGNTLVGFATYDEVQTAVTHTENTQGKLLFDDAMTLIEQDAHVADAAFWRFRQQQVRLGQDIDPSAKEELKDKLRDLDDRLNWYLAREYGINPNKTADLKKWKDSHNPFHWFVDFYGIMKSGGFDVIVGNPPYLETREIDYDIKNYACLDSAAIHAMCMERSDRLLRKHGCMSMIVPLSLPSTQRMQIVQQLLEKNRNAWYANYSWRPAKLFDTVNRALTIFVVTPSEAGHTFSTNYQMWTSDNRDGLFERLGFVEVSRSRLASWVPKIGNMLERSILDKCLAAKAVVKNFTAKSEHRIYYRTDGGLYWKVFTDFAPEFNLNGIEGHSSRETWFTVANKEHVKPIIAALSSDVFWWWYTVTSNVRHLNPFDVQNFPIPESALADLELRDLGQLYLKDIKRNSTMLVRDQKQTGRTETQSFKIQKSKPIVDKIDVALGQYYGFTEDELDFVINYDIKYRLGAEAADD